jgi:DHA2 family multidrug resistance protein
MRLILAIGYVMLALALWQMTGYSPEMDFWPIITAGLVQGAGLGFTFVPLSTAALSTLPMELRTEGSAVFNLLRNIGGSIGISVVEAVLANNIQINHAEMTQSVTPFNPALHLPGVREIWSLHSLTGLSLLDQQINFQAAFIGYLDDFKLMMVVCLLVLPMLLLLKPASRRGGAPTVVMD